LTLIARGRGIEEQTRRDIDPAAGPLVVEVRQTLTASARVVGILVGPDGKPVANAHVAAARLGDR